jgi:hypothetical protein
MIKKIVIRNTEVGAFILCDVKYLESYGGKPLKFMRVPVGMYTADISVKSRGGAFIAASKLKKKGTLQISSGKLFVGSPGEVFKGKGSEMLWDTFITKTHLLKKVPVSVQVIETAGDGLGEITFTLTKKGEV